MAEKKRVKQKDQAAIVPREVSRGFGGLSHLVDPAEGTRTRAALERAGRFGNHTGACPSRLPAVHIARRAAILISLCAAQPMCAVHPSSTRRRRS